MKYIFALIIITVLPVLSGCAGMADSMNKMAGLGVVTEGVSTFDSSKTVNVTPNWLYATDSQWIKTKLGAFWTSASPDHVVLNLSYSSDVKSTTTYLGFTELEVNIDGEKSSYKVKAQTSLDSSDYNTVSKTIYTTSKNSVVIPFSVLISMINSKDCRIRIHTTEGFEDAVFSIERSSSGQSTALFSIREFASKVQAVR